MKSSLPIGVIGGGGFGRALAQAAARTGREVRLWSRTPRNLGENIECTSDIGALTEAELLFLAVPSSHIPAVGPILGEHLDGRHLLVHVSRGLVGDELQTLSQHLRQVTPCRRLGVLAGPLVASALAEGSPSGALIGTRFPEVAAAVREALCSTDTGLRLYETRDILGAEIASALVGLLALAAGYTRHQGVGPAALAVFLTRGMAEGARLAETLGGNADTFAGLAGYGDLLAVMAGDERPEVRLGAALARGLSPQEAAAEAGAHIEGISIAARLVAHAERMQIEAPIATMIARTLEGSTNAADAMAALMARRVRTE